VQQFQPIHLDPSNGAAVITATVRELRSLVLVHEVKVRAQERIWRRVEQMAVYAVLAALAGFWCYLLRV